MLPTGKFMLTNKNVFLLAVYSVQNVAFDYFY